MAKLTEEDVRAIRISRDAGATLRVLAEQYGVDQSCISLIALRKHWKHVA